MLREQMQQLVERSLSDLININVTNHSEIKIPPQAFTFIGGILKFT